MKQLIIICLFLVGIGSFAQTDSRSAFDFWIGDWEVSWTDVKGNTVNGHNKIEKILDGNGIQEHFSDSTNQYFGTSISVYNAADSSWYQTWMDSRGGVIHFEGIVDDGIRIFQTKPEKVEDEVVIRRMLFYNITPDSFTWDWEISRDGGKNWKLSWQIQYVRKKGKK